MKFVAKILKIFLLVIITTLVLTGCDFFDISSDKENEEQQKKLNETTDAEGWYSGMEVKQSTVNLYDSDNNGEMITAHFDPTQFTIEIQESDPAKSLRDWCADVDNIAVINGGYFMENYKPTGLLITDQGVSSRSYVDETKGIFGIINNEELLINNLGEGAGDTSRYDYALQSFPMLVEGGRDVVVSKNTESAKRSFVALDRDGNLIIGNTNSAGLTLDAFGEYLGSSDLNTDIALNLDGGSSSGLCLRNKEGSLIYEDYSLSLIPHVIVVKAK